MPVWGRRYVDQFLEFCLPTLLAPGNLPSVTALAPCQFVLLSSAEDAPVVAAHPTWRELQRLCDAEIRLIDDLIANRNHSATITLAFARAIRQAGDAMLDTCFVLLNSDYLFADGSLNAVVRRICDGASGILAGNYQIVAEDAIPHMRGQIKPSSAAIALSPRELVQWSFQHLHPATCANIVNSGSNHNSHINRLFWRVDDDTLIGRFYLLHIIAVRPEVTDFIVGASFDYSFVPEMCSSGNVQAVTDSDEYLVVEMQPRDHESSRLLPGPIKVSELAESLSEWATAGQRANVDRTFVYHAAAIPDSLPRFVAEADAYTARVRELLTREPHPYRHHHYWLGSLGKRRMQTHQIRDLAFILGEAPPSPGLAGLVVNLRTAIFGTPPDVTPLHPRWPDYELARRAVKRISSSGRLLLLASRPERYAGWLTCAATEVKSSEYEGLSDFPADFSVQPGEQFDACLVILAEGQFSDVDTIVSRAAPPLAPGGQIVIFVTNDRPLSTASGFCESLAQPLSRLADSGAWRIQAHYVPTAPARSAVYQAMERLLRRGGASGWRSPFHAAIVAMTSLPLVLASFVCNLTTTASPAPPASELCSSVLFILSLVQKPKD